MHAPSRLRFVQPGHPLAALHAACGQQGVAQVQAQALVLAGWMQALGLVPARPVPTPTPTPTPTPHKEN